MTSIFDPGDMLRRMLDVREELEDLLDWSLYFGGNLYLRHREPSCGG